MFERERETQLHSSCTLFKGLWQQWRLGHGEALGIEHSVSLREALSHSCSHVLLLSLIRMKLARKQVSGICTGMLVQHTEQCDGLHNEQQCPLVMIFLNVFYILHDNMLIYLFIAKWCTLNSFNVLVIERG